jgi:sugar phosphate isomerase/epimerase
VKICERLGLEIETAHTSFERINAMWLDGTEGEDMTRLFIEDVRLAKECNIPVLILHVSSGFTPPPFNELGLSRFRRICEQAEKDGVAIAFENLRIVEYLDYVMENIDSPAKRFCFDCGHEFIYNNGFGVLEKYAPLLSAFHLHDNFGSQDDHLLPFEAKINWETLAERISHALAGRTDIPLTLEVMKADAEPDFAEKALNASAKSRLLLSPTNLILFNCACKRRGEQLRGVFCFVNRVSAGANLQKQVSGRQLLVEARGSKADWT